MKFCPSCGARYEDAAKFCQHDGTLLRSAGRASDEDPYVGQVLIGQFEIKEVIGEGGMGRVYRAHQHGFDRPVAIKILHTDLVTNPEMVKRFNREAKIISHLDHPSIIHVYLFGELPDGNLYLAMEYVDGQGLTKLINEGPVPVPQAVHIARQILSALTEAHRKGVVHRDLKPDNIMLVARPDDPQTVKVLDFGIAKFLGSRTMLTQQGLVFGSARYISPEAAAGESVDERADLYAVGVILYQMLSGKPPFDDASAVSLLMRHVNDKPPPLLKQPGARHVPEGIGQVVMQALEKDPARRFSGAAAMRTALTEAARVAAVPLQGDDVAASWPSPQPQEHSSKPTPVLGLAQAQAVEPAPAEGRAGLFKTDPMFGGAMSQGKAGPEASSPHASGAPTDPPRRQGAPPGTASPQPASTPLQYSQGDEADLDRTQEAAVPVEDLDDEKIALPRSRAWVALLVVLILVLAGGAMGALLALENRDEDPPPAGRGETEPAKLPGTNVTPPPPPPPVTGSQPDAGLGVRPPPPVVQPPPPVVEAPPTQPPIGVGGQGSTGPSTQAGTATGPQTKTTGTVRPRTGTSSAGGMPPSAALAIEPRRPQVGQKVRLTVKVSPATTLTSPRFTITLNKGQPVTERAEAVEGGYSARHVFAKAGTYQIAFVGTSPSGEVQAFGVTAVSPTRASQQTTGQEDGPQVGTDSSNKPPDHEEGPPPQLIEPWMSPNPW